MEKICSKCKQEKPVSDFYKHKRDGYQSRCKPCHREGNREYRRKPEVKERVNSYMREYHRRPEVRVKRVARIFLGTAVRYGKIHREPCVMCDKEQGQGHHPDYDQPLLIVWLCPKCHQSLHNQEKAELWVKE